MFSSAVLRVAALDLPGAAEVQTHESPAPAIAAPGGADRNRSLHPRKELLHVRRYQERERATDRADLQHVGEEGPRVPGAREGREEVTAPAPVNLVALERAIAKVLCDYGLGDHDTVRVNARPIEQGGYIAGVTIDAFTYTRPAELPPAPRAAAESAAAAEDLEAVS